ncbi:MAG: hypothetical protein ACYC4U_22610 [Pirellulaceae bacterium]
MKKIIALGTTVFAYFCVATIIAQAAAVGTLWAKGALDRGRMYRVLAALQGIDLVTMQAQLVSPRNVADTEQPSLAARLETQQLKNLDMDLREASIDNGRNDLLALQKELSDQQSAFVGAKKAYDTVLKEMVEEQMSARMKELQRTIEAMQPAQAKAQLLKMLDDDAMDDVVALVTNMPSDKRKKIIAEFNEGTDADQLYEILKFIRQGEPIASTIQEARDILAPGALTP